MKQMWMRLLGKKRKGFTLVELLIVIIIIGILAGAMLLVAGSGTDKAEATRIVSDLRTIKSAAMMYYADNGSWTNDLDNLKSYMGSSGVDTAQFNMLAVSNDYYIGRKVTSYDNGVKAKLKDMASKDKNLFGGSDRAVNTTAYNNEDWIYMQVR